MPGGRRLRLWAAVLATLTLVLPSFASAQTTPAGAAVGPNYVIGPGDELDVVVAGEPRLSGRFTVRSDGRFSLPLIQDVLAAGETTGTLAEGIERSLGRYIRRPRVEIGVARAVGATEQQIRVIGEVELPAAVPYVAGITVADVVREAGGLTPDAAGNRARIIRQVEGVTEEISVRLADIIRAGDASANTPLNPGDIVYVPEGFVTGDLRFVPTLVILEEYSDNVDLDPDGAEESAFTTTVSPGIILRADLARISAAAEGEINIIHQTNGDDDGLNVDGELLGFGTVEVLRNNVFVDGAAAIAQQVFNNEEADADANEETVQVYQISPFVVNRIDDFATTELRYTLSQVLADGDAAADASDSTTHTVSGTLGSGSRFSDLRWALNAVASEAIRSDDDDISRQEIDLGIDYQIVQDIALLGGVGYQSFDDGNPLNEFDGPTWRAGFRWEPGPRTFLEATYGLRDDEESLALDFRYDITARTTFRASYEEGLETPLERIETNLGFVGLDPETGEIIDTRGGTPFDPFLNIIDVDDETTRTEVFNAGLDTELGRNAFALNGIYIHEEEAATGLDDETTYGLTAEWERPLSRRVIIGLFGGYQRQEFEDEDREDDEFEISPNLTYTIGPNVNAFASYTYLRNESTDDQEEYEENRVLVALRAQF